MPTVAQLEKETEKISKKISTEYKECVKTIVLYKAEVDKHKKTHAKLHQVTDMHAKRVTQLTGDQQWSAGARTGAKEPPVTPLASEQYIDADPAIQQVNVLLEKMNKLFESEGDVLDKMKAKLTKERKDLGMSVGELQENLEELKKARARAVASPAEKKAVALAADMDKYVTTTLPPIIRIYP